MTPPRLPRKKRFPTACVRAHDARMSGPSEKDEEEDEEEDIPFTPNSGDGKFRGRNTKFIMKFRGRNEIPRNSRDTRLNYPRSPGFPHPVRGSAEEDFPTPPDMH